MELFCMFTVVVVTELYSFVKTWDRSLDYMANISEPVVFNQGQFPPPYPETSGNVWR